MTDVEHTTQTRGRDAKAAGKRSLSQFWERETLDNFNIRLLDNMVFKV